VEKRVPGEDNLVIPVLHEIADAVLGMAWRMQRLYGNVADIERLAMFRRLCDLLTILPSDYLQGLAEL
jgi:hypothetical protein